MIRATLIATAATMASTATAQQAFVGVNITSWHVNASRDFNQNNIGLLAGMRWGEKLQYGFEAGFFQNSYNAKTTYALGFADYPIAQIGAVQLRGGVWAGMFEYPAFTTKAYAKGLPIWGSYIGAAGLSATARLNKFDLQAKVTRGLTNANAIVTLQMMRSF